MSVGFEPMALPIALPNRTEDVAVSQWTSHHPKEECPLFSGVLFVQNAVKWHYKNDFFFLDESAEQYRVLLSHADTMSSDWQTRGPLLPVNQ